MTHAIPRKKKPETELAFLFVVMEKLREQNHVPLDFDEPQCLADIVYLIWRWTEFQGQQEQQATIVMEHASMWAWLQTGNLSVSSATQTNPRWVGTLHDPATLDRLSATVADSPAVLHD